METLSNTNCVWCIQGHAHICGMRIELWWTFNLYWNKNAHLNPELIDSACLPSHLVPMISLLDLPHTGLHTDRSCQGPCLLTWELGMEFQSSHLFSMIFTSQAVSHLHVLESQFVISDSCFIFRYVPRTSNSSEP